VNLFLEDLLQLGHGLVDALFDPDVEVGDHQGLVGSWS
jgi:hypothetical protein